MNKYDKMVYSSRFDKNYTIWDPYAMSNNDLFDLSLAQLAKSLPQDTSFHPTFFIYLRWLEVHRREPTKRTEHWQNTLLHWTQSLRSRGFRETDIVTAVEDWKEANGPFHSWWRRYPPTPKDIFKAFDEMRSSEKKIELDRDRDLAERLNRPLGGSYRPKESSHESTNSPPSKPQWSKAKKEGKKHRPEVYEQKPPPNYICNRCGEKGAWRTRFSILDTLCFLQDMYCAEFCIFQITFLPQSESLSPPAADLNQVITFKSARRI
jgi:hypothetical protein